MEHRLEIPIFLLLSSLANADAILIPCPEGYVSATLPDVGAEGVPVDIAPAFVWRDDCLQGGGYTVRLEQEGVVLLSQDFVIDGERLSGLHRLELGAALSADSAYTLVVAIEGQETEVPFTTGSERVQGAQDPSVTEHRVEARDDRSGVTLFIYGSAEAGADPDELSVLLRLDQAGEVLQADVGPAADFFDNAYPAQVPVQSCTWIAQEDGAGVRSEVVESCVAVEVVRGCSSRPGAPLPLALLAGLFGLLFRRRR